MADTEHMGGRGKKPFATEADLHRHMAGAYRYAAEVFVADSPARQAFAPVLAEWAERREVAAIAAEIPDQPDLFSTPTQRAAA